MAEHGWSVLCQKDIIDQEDNSISLIQVVSQITISGRDAFLGDLKKFREAGEAGLPLPATFRLVTSWERTNESEPETAKLRVRTVPPKGTPSTGNEFEISLVEVDRCRMRIDLTAITIQGYGRHWVELSKKKGSRWLVRARLPIHIIDGDLVPEANR